jgi:hypothetical protein
MAPSPRPLHFETVSVYPIVSDFLKHMRESMPIRNALHSYGHRRKAIDSPTRGEQSWGTGR